LPSTSDHHIMRYLRIASVAALIPNSGPMRHVCDLCSHRTGGVDSGTGDATSGRLQGYASTRSCSPWIRSRHGSTDCSPGCVYCPCCRRSYPRRSRSATPLGSRVHTASWQWARCGDSHFAHTPRHYTATHAHAHARGWSHTTSAGSCSLQGYC
jgi:hypothetical protein